MPAPKKRPKTPRTSRARVIKRELKQLSGSQVAEMVSASAKQPQRARALLAKGLNARRLRDRGLTADKLADAGYMPADLRELGYGVGDIWGARHFLIYEDPKTGVPSVGTRPGFDLAGFLQAKFTFPEVVKKFGSDAEGMGQLIGAGFTLQQLIRAGCYISDFKAFPSHLAALDASQRRRLETIEERHKNASRKGHAERIAEGQLIFRAIMEKQKRAEERQRRYERNSADSLIKAGKKAPDLIAAGFSAGWLKELGFSLSELIALEFTLRQLARAGFPARDLINAGSSQAEVDAAFSKKTK